jgi:hypothetical protein
MSSSFSEEGASFAIALAILRVKESLRRLPTKTPTLRTGGGGIDLFRRENWFATGE